MADWRKHFLNQKSFECHNYFGLKITDVLTMEKYLTINTRTTADSCLPLCNDDYALTLCSFWLFLVSIHLRTEFCPGPFFCSSVPPPLQLPPHRHLQRGVPSPCRRCCRDKGDLWPRSCDGSPRGVRRCRHRTGTVLLGGGRLQQLSVRDR